MVGTNIKTGADKLVDLISEKKKITVNDAAKILGVGKDVVQEWAEFLEEEGSVELEYSLSKVWIHEKRIMAKDIINSAKEVASEKDAFSRKIDAALQALQQETSGFEDIRKEFRDIQRHIRDETDIVKKQLTELDRFDSLRKNLDKDVSKQHNEYKAIFNEAEEKLKLESQKYDDLKSLIEKERKTVVQYSEKIEELKKLRNDYERTVASLKESLKNIDHVMDEYRKRFDDSNRIMSNYKTALDKLDFEISEKKGTVLTKKLESLKNNDIRLSKSMLMLETDIRQRMGSLQSYGDVSGKVHSAFSGFFSKNADVEKLISEIENDKTDLTKEMESLKAKVDAFTLAASNPSIKSQIKDIDSQIKNFERRKSSIQYKVEKLLSFIKGK
jgi:chromosome segregation ATPase